jgi:hypothetical protein
MRERIGRHQGRIGTDKAVESAHCAWISCAQSPTVQLPCVYEFGDGGWWVVRCVCVCLCVYRRMRGLNVELWCVVRRMSGVMCVLLCVLLAKIKKTKPKKLVAPVIEPRNIIPCVKLNSENEDSEHNWTGGNVWVRSKSEFKRDHKLVSMQARELCVCCVCVCMCVSCVRCQYSNCPLFIFMCESVWCVRVNRTAQPQGQAWAKRK